MAPLKRSYTGYAVPSKRTKVMAVRAMSKTGSDISELNTKVAQLSRQLAKVKSRREVKHKDAESTNQVIGFDTNEVTDLSAIAQGPVSDERIGEEVSPSRIEIRGTLVNPGSASVFGKVRVLLVQMRDSSVPTTINTAGFTQLVERQTSADAVNAPYEWDNRDKFTVLSDRLISLQRFCDTDECGASFVIKTKVSRKIRFATSTTTYESGGLYLCFIPNRVASSNMQMRFQSRLFFYDD